MTYISPELNDECEHCENGYIESEWPKSLGGGPRQDFTYEVIMEPCTHCNQANLDDDEQPDEAQEWEDFNPFC